MMPVKYQCRTEIESGSCLLATKMTQLRYIFYFIVRLGQFLQFHLPKAILYFSLVIYIYIYKVIETIFR